VEVTRNSLKVDKLTSIT